MKPRPIKYPLDLHPATAKNESASNGLKALLDASTAINEALGKVKDPKALATAIKARAAVAERTARGALKNATGASVLHTQAIADRLRKRSEFEKETRDFVRAQKSPANAVRQMIASGDEAGVAAVFRAPPYLSGLDDDAVRTLYVLAKTRFLPDLHEKETAADEGIQRLSRAMDHFSAELQRLDKEISGSDDAIASALTPKKDPVE